MKQTLQAVIFSGIVTLLAIGLSAVFMPTDRVLADTPQRPYPTTYETWSSSSYTTDTLTLAKVGFECTIANDDTTHANTFTFTMNSVSDAYTMYGGDALKFTDFPVYTIVITAGNGTPAYQVICLEQ